MTDRMPMRRITLVVAVLGTAVAVALPMPLATADPAPPVGIGAAQTDPAQHGTFRVSAWSDEPGAAITAVTASVHLGTSVVATPGLTDGGAGFWTNPEPLKLTEDGGPMPALGRYSIDVTATDDHGNTTTRVDAGTLDYTLVPQLAADSAGNQLHFTPATLDLQHTSTAVTGTLLGAQPGSGDLVPVANRAVAVTRSYDDPAAGAPATVPATTDAQGRFTTGSFALAHSAGFTASFSGSDDEVDGTSLAYGAPAINPTPLHITAKANHSRVAPGQKLTITGVVRRGSSSSSAIVAGAPLSVSMSGYGQPPVLVRTSSTGHFSATIIAVPAYYSQWSVTPFGSFVTGDPVDGTAIVPNEAQYAGVGIKIDPRGWVTAHGSLVATYVDQQTGYEVSRLEYSKDGRSHWTRIASASNPYANEVTVSGWGYVSGYYRLHHLSSNQFADTASAPVHLSRIVTRISANDASPEPVALGRTVTVTGRLQEHRGRSWKLMAHRPVDLYFEATGTKTWHLVSVGRSDAHGRARLRGTATKTGRWLLQYFGDTTHFNSSGTADAVTVR